MAQLIHHKKDLIPPQYISIARSCQLSVNWDTGKFLLGSCVSCRIRDIGQRAFECREEWTLAPATQGPHAGVCHLYMPVLCWSYFLNHIRSLLTKRSGVPMRVVICNSQRENLQSNRWHNLWSPMNELYKAWIEDMLIEHSDYSTVTEFPGLHKPINILAARSCPLIVFRDGHDSFLGRGWIYWQGCVFVNE